MSNLEKLNKIISNKKSTWLEDAKWREANEEWLNYSFSIALRVLTTLRTKGMTQKELAEKIGVSPQHINKIVKGQENLSLETIAKLGMALEIKLIEVPSVEDGEGISYDFDQAYEVSELLRKEFFAKASVKGLYGLEAVQSYVAEEEQEYQMSA